MAQVPARSRLKALAALAHPGILFALLLFVAVRAFAGTTSLAWDPVISPSLVGYMVYYGPAAGNYPTRIDVGNTTSYAVSNLVEGATYHFAATAYDASHMESGFSNDVSATVPYSAPVAQFSASTTSGSAPLALNFTSTSSGTISTYAWTFGDATTSSAQNPSHVYAAAGVYTVSLTVSGPGGSNTQTRSNYITVVNAAGGTNVALASTGALASASSTYSSTLPVAAINNNERAGTNWGNGGGWADATPNVYPDWVQINFNGNKTIDRVVVYTVQDNYSSPVEPTDTQTFSLYGVTDFSVQAWNGSAWVTLGTVNGNNLVKRTVSFGPYTTDRIRINITGALASSSRITEVEAWGVSAGPSNVALGATGAVASASSTFSAAHPVAAIINNDRAGASWGNGGGWADGTPNAYPDWVQIIFSGSKTIDHVVVYTVQDNFASPIEPTDTQTFSLFGMTDFTVQGWNGNAWVTLGTVTGNNLVKRTVSFAAYTTDRIRINVTNALASSSRITEIEAWGVDVAP